MLKLFLVGAGGCLGAVARYAVSGLVHAWFRGTFPVGTLVVNVAGCFAIGIFMGLVEDYNLFSPEVRVLVTVGFLGSVTTFSTFGHETLELLRSGGAALALANVGANLLLALGAVVAGRVAAGLIAGV